MSEMFSVHNSQEQRIQEMQPFLETNLHAQQIDIDLTAGPLMHQAEAVEVFGINGDILATITLPSDTEAKEIAIVDYGEPDPTNPKPITIFEGKPLPVLGKARERYGLRALNYSPREHLSSHVGFNEGTTLNIGRDNERSPLDENYKLGLSTGDVEDALISRKHATISIQDGKLSIIDHSTNGSLVRSANPERSEVLPPLEDVHTAIGYSALSGAEIQQPTQEMQRPVKDIYLDLADTASKLSQGNIEPNVQVGKMKRLIEAMPAEERAALGDITELINSIVDPYGREKDRYSTNSVARRISDLTRARISKL